MKLKGNFLLVEKDQFEKAVIPNGEAEQRFAAMLENESVNYIFQFLMEETTEEEIVRKMSETFEAPEADIREDVHIIVNGLRNTGFLEE